MEGELERQLTVNEGDTISFHPSTTTTMECKSKENNPNVVQPGTSSSSDVMQIQADLSENNNSMQDSIPSPATDFYAQACFSTLESPRISEGDIKVESPDIDEIDLINEHVEQEQEKAQQQQHEEGKTSTETQPSSANEGSSEIVSTEASVLQENDPNVFNVQHSQPANFSCEVCKKEFKQKHHLLRHLPSHYNRKPFKCSVIACGKSFTRKENLTKHSKIHQSEKQDDDHCLNFEEEEEDEDDNDQVEEEMEKLPRRGPGRPKKPLNYKQMESPPWPKKKVLGVKNTHKDLQSCLREGDKIHVTCHKCNVKFYSMKKFQAHLKKKNSSKNSPTSYKKVLQNRKLLYLKTKTDSDLNSASNENKAPIYNKSDSDSHLLNPHRSSQVTVKVQLKESASSKFCDKCGKNFRSEKNLSNHIRLFHGQVEQEQESLDEGESQELYHDNDDNSDLDIIQASSSSKQRKAKIKKRKSAKNSDDRPVNGDGNCDGDVEEIEGQDPPDADSSSPSDVFLQSLDTIGCPRLPFVCMICRKGFSRKFHLKRHLTRKSFRCKYSPCEDIFEYKCAMRAHHIEHENELTADLPEQELAPIDEGSDNIYSRPKKRRPKIGVGEPKKPKQNFLCSSCGKAFHSSSVFRKHIARQNCDISGDGKERLWKCKQEDCNLEFESKIDLKKHAKLHAQLTERPFPCTFPDCTKAFFKASGLKYHLLGHNGIKPFKCTEPDCELAYASSSNLRHHIKAVHLNEKLFLCQDCGKTFGTQTKLKIHIRVHTGERPYVCQVSDCRFAFTTPGALSRHMKCHEKAKEYKCDQCGKGFNLRENLKRHLQTHTGLKPYKCKLCPLAFPDNRPLKRHMITHHDDDGNRDGELYSD